MQTVELEKFYLVSYTDGYGRPRIVSVKPWQHYGSAKYHAEELRKRKFEGSKGYTNIRVIELDCLKPEKTRFVK